MYEKMRNLLREIQLHDVDGDDDGQMFNNMYPGPVDWFSEYSTRTTTNNNSYRIIR